MHVSYLVNHLAHEPIQNCTGSLYRSTLLYLMNLLFMRWLLAHSEFETSWSLVDTCTDNMVFRSQKRPEAAFQVHWPLSQGWRAVKRVMPVRNGYLSCLKILAGLVESIRLNHAYYLARKGSTAFSKCKKPFALAKECWLNTYLGWRGMTRVQPPLA